MASSSTRFIKIESAVAAFDSDLKTKNKAAKKINFFIGILKTDYLLTIKLSKEYQMNGNKCSLNM